LRFTFPQNFWGKKYEYKIYLSACPIELAHSKEITISFEQKPVTVAIIWKENKFQQMVHLFHTQYHNKENGLIHMKRGSA
jgi:hypothetical protein